MINFVIEKCNERKSPEDEFRRYLLDRVFGRKSKEGNWIIFPNTFTYERAVELYREATK